MLGADSAWPLWEQAATGEPLTLVDPDARIDEVVIRAVARPVCFGFAPARGNGGAVLVCAGLMIPTNTNTAAAADTVRLRNGDVISGKLLSVSGGKAVVDTVHSGDVVILMEEVVAIDTDRVMTVEYQDGREIDGIIETSAEGIITVREGAAPETAEVVDPPAALDLADIEAIHEVTPY